MWSPAASGDSTARRPGCPCGSGNLSHTCLRMQRHLSALHWPAAQRGAEWICMGKAPQAKRWQVLEAVQPCSPYIKGWHPWAAPADGSQGPSKQHSKRDRQRTHGLLAHGGLVGVTRGLVVVRERNYGGAHAQDHGRVDLAVRVSAASSKAWVIGWTSSAGAWLGCQVMALSLTLDWRGLPVTVLAQYAVASIHKIFDCTVCKRRVLSGMQPACAWHLKHIQIASSAGTVL